MDAKITKTRLSRLLSYDWLKIILAAAAAILVWSLIFTMTATRITPAQQFTVFNHEGSTPFMSTSFDDLYAKAFQDKVFSYEVIETNVNDLAANKEYASTLMEARLATEEGDVMFVPDIDDPNTAKQAEGEETVEYEFTYLETFIMRNRPYVYELDPEKETSFFGKMELYLDGFYDGGWENAESLNEEKVETQFRARVKKDKRFKKEKQIKQGVQEDIERIKKYRDALEKFYAWEEAGIVSFTTTVFSDREAEKDVYYPADGMYSINLCPNVKTMDGLKKYVGYNVERVDENGKKYYPVTAENMNVAFFYFDGVEEGFQYESLLFVNYLIEAALAETQATQQK